MRAPLGYVDPQGNEGWWDQLRLINPSAVGEQMRLVNSQNELIQATIEDNEQISEQVGGIAFLRAWAAYYESWGQFYRENQGFFDRWSSTTVDQLVSLTRQSNAYEENLRELNVDTGQPTRDEVTPPDTSSNYRAFLGAGLLVAGIFGIAWLTREARGAAAQYQAMQVPPPPPLSGRTRLRRRRLVAG